MPLQNVPDAYSCKQFFNCKFELPEKAGKASMLEFADVRAPEKTIDIRIVDIGLQESGHSLMIMFDDISDRLRDYRVQKLNGFKNRLMNSLSHNLKTPLHGIMMLAQIGIGQAAPDEKDECFQDINRNGTILLNLIQQLQLQFKEESGDVETRAEELDVADVLRTVAWIFQKQLELKHIQFAASLCCEATQIRNDEEKLLFVLIQLVENSIKFSGEQTRITVSVRDDPENAHLLEIAIADQGCGISANTVLALEKNLADRFFEQSRSAQSKYTHGIGLGLDVCKRVIRLIGPRDQKLVIESDERTGTRISFLIFKRARWHTA